MIERTLAIIKPDAWPRHGGAIITMATEAGLVPVEAKVVRPNIPGKFWSDFYDEHFEKHFFDSLVEFMASGPVLVCVLSGDCAVSHWRELMGSTDSRKARPDTVRGRFGAPNTESVALVMRGFSEVIYPMWRNAVHGSDSPAAAEREIAFFFEKTIA